MKSIKYFISLTFITFVTAVLLVGCSTISVNQDYDPGYDFSKLKTFGFLPIPKEAGIDQINANRFGDAIKNELTAKGYTVSDKADFGVALLFGKQTKTNITSYGYGYGPYWGRYGGTSNVDVSQYDEGTLIIDVIDMAKKELVWRGTGTGAIDPNATVEERTANINSAVAQILAQFPPTPVQK
ncbi:MAG TPA: DUF4136 domain-containing protein [Ignavibacteriaceae bacterium]